jgi:hypothetical protein
MEENALLLALKRTPISGHAESVTLEAGLFLIPIIA